MSKEWFYVNEGAQTGPVPEDEILRHIRNGTIKGDTLVWSEGMADWEPASAHFETRRRFGPPSVPRGAAPAEPPGHDPYPQPRGGRQTGRDGLYIGSPYRGFVEAISVCLRGYFRFSGRASRSEYWFFVLFGILLGFAAGILDNAIFGFGTEYQPLSTVATFGLLIPTLAVGFRRMHDIGRTGLWVLFLYLGPIVFGLAMLFFFVVAAGAGLATILSAAGVLWLILLVVVLVFLCTRGDPGPNAYG